MKMKKFALTLALLLVTAGLSSCGSDTTGPSESPGSTGNLSSPGTNRIELQTQEALKIGDVSISVAEFDFYYFNAFHSLVETYESMGLSDFLDLDYSLPFSEQEYEDGLSWQDFFKETAIEDLTEVVLQSQAAIQDGMNLTDVDYENIALEIEYMQNYADEEGISFEDLLQEVYGTGMSAQVFEDILERSYLSDLYRNTVIDEYKIGSEEITAYYEQNRNDFTLVDYHSVIIDSELYEEDLGRTPTEEEQTNYEETRRTLAETLYAKVTDAVGFREAAAEFLEDEEYPEDEEEEDSTFREGIYLSELEDSQAAFLSDPSRKEGDKILLEEEGYFEVLLFVSRYSLSEEDREYEIQEILQEERYAAQLDTLRGSYPVTENRTGMAIAMQFHVV